MYKLPVAILSHGDTVEFTEYWFSLANVFAARGYIAISIQHDLPTDPPMVTKVGELYVGRSHSICAALPILILPSSKCETSSRTQIMTI